MAASPRLTRPHPLPLLETKQIGPERGSEVRAPFLSKPSLPDIRDVTSWEEAPALSRAAGAGRGVSTGKQLGCPTGQPENRESRRERTEEIRKGGKRAGEGMRDHNERDKAEEESERRTQLVAEVKRREIGSVPALH